MHLKSLCLERKKSKRYTFNWSFTINPQFKMMHNFACFFYRFSIITAASSLILLCLALLNLFILVSQHKLLNCGFFWLADSCENNYCFVKYTTKITVYQLLVKHERKARAMEHSAALERVFCSNNCVVG